MLIDCISTSGLASRLKLSRRSSALLEEAVKRCMESAHQIGISQSSMIDGTPEKVSKITLNSGHETKLFPPLKGKEWKTAGEVYLANSSEPSAVVNASLKSTKQNSKNPRQYEDDLRASGTILGHNYVEEIQASMSYKPLAVWIYRLFLNIDEHSVRSWKFGLRLDILNLNVRNFLDGFQLLILFQAFFKLSKAKLHLCRMIINYSGYFLHFMMRFWMMTRIFGVKQQLCVLY